jgi:hypothetical protein
MNERNDQGAFGYIGAGRVKKGVGCRCRILTSIDKVCMRGARAWMWSLIVDEKRQVTRFLSGHLVVLSGGGGGCRLSGGGIQVVVVFGNVELQKCVVVVVVVWIMVVV